MALYEGACPRLGFEYVLAHYGTCNAITLFDGQMHGRPKSDRQEVAALLINHLHGELLRNVKADIAVAKGANLRPRRSESSSQTARAIRERQLPRRYHAPGGCRAICPGMR